MDPFAVAINHADLEDSMSARMILSGIQPENEAYLEYQLALMTKQERKGTGTLKPDQVCIIL